MTEERVMRQSCKINIYLISAGMVILLESCEVYESPAPYYDYYYVEPGYTSVYPVYPYYYGPYYYPHRHHWH